MKDIAGKFSQVILVRFLPGVLNVGTLLLIVEWLSTGQFGEYSTVVATTAFVANLVFGPLIFAIVPYHARFESEGQGKQFEAAVISTALVISTLFVAIGALVAVGGLTPIAYVAPGVTFGLYTIALEVLRARLRFWSFGLASIIQSLILLSGVLYYVARNPDAETALHVFSVSYLISFLFALALIGNIRLVRPNLALLGDSLSEGGKYTLSAGLEGSLTLSLRYMVLLLGSPQLLGAFSFALDFAQRVIGIFINILSFTVVPTAFKTHGYDRQQFESNLRRGAAYAATACVLALFATIIGSNFSWIPGIGSALFDPVSFILISLAVIVNRTKKITIDQVALRDGNAGAILRGMMVAMPISLLVAWGLHYVTSAFAEVAFLTGYLTASAATAYAAWQMRGRAPD